jgi:prepilin peptidase CpaA
LTSPYGYVKIRGSGHIGEGLKPIILGLAVALALIAGWTDWRSRRIPNWLTVPALLLGIATNTMGWGWSGTKHSLLGAALGIGLLLPLALARGIGMGDLKFVGAAGSFLGPDRLLTALVGSVFINGVMALMLAIYKGRLRETLRNIGKMLAALAHLRLPGPEFTLDNPNTLKIPYGVAFALTMVLYAIAWARGAV